MQHPGRTTNNQLRQDFHFLRSFQVGQSQRAIANDAFRFHLRERLKGAIVPELNRGKFPGFSETFSRLAEGFVDRRTLLSEELRSTLSDVETIFDAECKPAIDPARR